MNTIGHITFDFKTRNEAFTRELYSRWDSFFAQAFEQVADDVLSRFDIASEQIEIEQLELNIGTLNEHNFNEEFPVRIKETLEEALIQSLNNTSLSKKVTRTSSQENIFNLLRHFLLYGFLPWNAPQQYQNISHLFLLVLQTEAQKLKQFLLTYGHYSSLQQRLVYQLNDPELEQGIYLLRKSESTFICSYVYFLKRKYQSIAQPSINETNYRYAIWSVVYAYVLNDRSSLFNRKSFLHQTIINLARKFNLSYTYLLKNVTLEINHFIEKNSTIPELLLILDELKKETVEKEIKESFFDMRKLYHLISSSLKKEMEASDSQMTKEILIAVLTNEDSCRSFIKFLREEEIVRVVPIVIPSESEFVIHYARSLDTQKEQGVLQGKAGGEFAKLKWMILFPLLLVNNGTGFNRKHFVLNVLRKIAAHYNLEVMSLLVYFIQKTLHLDLVLLEILQTLHEETCKKIIDPVNEINQLIRIRRKIQSSEKLTDFEKTHLSYLLQQPIKGIEFIIELEEQEIHQLVAYFASDEKIFIIEYGVALDKQHQRSVLEGKAGSKFKYIKWAFIFNVITEHTTVAFNRRYFVSRVLKNIAAHYNLGYVELLNYFQYQKEQLCLPAALSTILQELFREEKKHIIAQILQTSQEANKYRMLEEFYPAEKTFIASLIKAIEKYQHLWTSSIDNRFSRLKWETIFSLLLENPNRPFDKQKFIKEFIRKITSFYQLPLKELYTQFYTAIKKDSISYPPDLMQILKMLSESNKQTSSPLNEHIMQTTSHTENEKHEEEFKVENDSFLYINNAGIVLLSAFLTRLFTMLELTENGKFKDRDAQIRSMFLIQYIVFKEVKFPEHEMTLNKILTGFQTGIPIPGNIELSDKEKEICESMMQGALQHWEKLKTSSLTSLREAFLQREARLETKSDSYMLTVETKAYDMLLDTLPWKYTPIKYAWMEKPVYVKWR